MVFQYDLSVPEAEKTRLDQALKHSITSPLHRHDSLRWKGPSLFPKALAPRSSSNQHRREPIDVLLSKRSPARLLEEDNWTLTMMEAIQVADPGEHFRCQVWRCKVKRGEKFEPDVSVVLKLYYPGVYYGSLDGKKYTNQRGLAEGEALAYERFTDLQGSDVPFCYGFYNFLTPTGSDLIGVVLEDLTTISKSLEDHVARAEDIYGDGEEFDGYMDQMLCELIRSRFRINKAEMILLHQAAGDSIFVLSEYTKTLSHSTSSNSVPSLVVVGFSEVYLRDDYMTHCEITREADWIRRVYSALVGEMCDVFGWDEVEKWKGMEHKRGLLRENYKNNLPVV